MSENDNNGVVDFRQFRNDNPRLFTEVERVMLQQAILGPNPVAHVLGVIESLACWLHAVGVKPEQLRDWLVSRAAEQAPEPDLVEQYAAEVRGLLVEKYGHLTK